MMFFKQKPLAAWVDSIKKEHQKLMLFRREDRIACGDPSSGGLKLHNPEGFAF